MKKNISPPTSSIRLSKHLADLSICSRREADQYIEKGWVWINGKVAILGQKTAPGDILEIDQKLSNKQQEQRTILLNKPIGYVSAQAEHGYKPAIELITLENYGDKFPPKIVNLRNFAPAGRLDIDSTGLLVLTQDGRIAKKIIGNENKIEKEYLVRVTGTLIPDGLELLNFGLSLDDKPLLPAKVNWQNKDQLKFILKEGKKRQIRRMCELVGLRVVGLKRVRIGKVRLGQLPLGKWRYLAPNEFFD